MLGWRPKDLHDLHQIFARVPLISTDLRHAIAAYMADMGGTRVDAQTIFGRSSWWGMKRSSARWQDFVDASREQDVQGDLAGVVADVASFLADVLEE
jgi:hypothetical protein